MDKILFLTRHALTACQQQWATAHNVKFIQIDHDLNENTNLRKIAVDSDCDPQNVFGVFPVEFLPWVATYTINLYTFSSRVRGQRVDQVDTIDGLVVSRHGGFFEIWEAPDLYTSNGDGLTYGRLSRRF